MLPILLALLGAARGLQTPNSWMQTNPQEGSQFQRQSPVTASIRNQSMLLFGDLATDFSTVGVTWLFSLEWNVWHNISTPVAPPSRALAAAASINGSHVFVFGGVSG